MLGRLLAGIGFTAAIAFAPIVYGQCQGNSQGGSRGGGGQGMQRQMGGGGGGGQCQRGGQGGGQIAMNQNGANQQMQQQFAMQQQLAMQQAMAMQQQIAMKKQANRQRVHQMSLARAEANRARTAEQRQRYREQLKKRGNQPKQIDYAKLNERLAASAKQADYAGNMKAAQAYLALAAQPRR